MGLFRVADTYSPNGYNLHVLTLTQLTRSWVQDYSILAMGSFNTSRDPFMLKIMLVLTLYVTERLE